MFFGNTCLLNHCFFLVLYIFQEKNLATKEDTSDLTHEIKSVRIEYASKLETIKAALGSQLYTYQTPYQNEFDILLDLSIKTIKLFDAVLGLRPRVDFYVSKKSLKRI